MFIVLVILLITSNVISAGIIWETDTQGIVWAGGCDFFGDDLYYVSVGASRCGPVCKDTNGCTHFTWYDDKCWIKSNRLPIRIAEYKIDAVCGIVP